MEELKAETVPELPPAVRIIRSYSSSSMGSLADSAVPWKSNSLEAITSASFATSAVMLNSGSSASVDAGGQHIK